LTRIDDRPSEPETLRQGAPVDDGVWDLTLGGLLLALALTLEHGRMPVLLLVAVPVIAALLRWTVTRPRIGPGGLRRQLEALKLGPLGLLAGLVVVGAAVIGAMAGDGREAFEPARSAAPGVAAAAILALAVISVLLAGRLRSSRFLVWAGLAVVGLLLDPLVAPEVRASALLVLSGVVIATGAWHLARFVRGSGPS